MEFLFTGQIPERQPGRGQINCRLKYTNLSMRVRLVVLLGQIRSLCIEVTFAGCFFYLYFGFYTCVFHMCVSPE